MSRAERCNVCNQEINEDGTVDSCQMECDRSLRSTHGDNYHELQFDNLGDAPSRGTDREMDDNFNDD